MVEGRSDRREGRIIVSKADDAPKCASFPHLRHDGPKGAVPRGLERQRARVLQGPGQERGGGQSLPQERRGGAGVGVKGAERGPGLV